MERRICYRLAQQNPKTPPPQTQMSTTGSHTVQSSRPTTKRQPKTDLTKQRKYQSRARRANSAQKQSSELESEGKDNHHQREDQKSHYVSKDVLVPGNRKRFTILMKPRSQSLPISTENTIVLPVAGCSPRSWGEHIQPRHWRAFGHL